MCCRQGNEADNDPGIPGQCRQSRAYMQASARAQSHELPRTEHDLVRICLYHGSLTPVIIVNHGAMGHRSG